MCGITNSIQAIGNPQALAMFGALAAGIAMRLIFFDESGDQDE